MELKIGSRIMELRRKQDMTQEEMAKRLGVTAAAVSKWENEVSYPDITLLAPIARLLGISLDALLSFQGELTDQEVNDLLQQAKDRLETEEFDQVFRWAKKQTEQYPNCEHLCLYLAVVLDAARIGKGVPDAGRYDADFRDTYERLLASKEENVRTMAADSLYGFYVRREQYEDAERYLEYFPAQDPERKRKQAALYEKTGRTREAYKSYEELLFSSYQRISVVIYSMFRMRLEEKNFKAAAYLAEKSGQAAELFEMGKYYKYAVELELAQEKKDIPGTLECAEGLLSSVDTLGKWCKSPLYADMAFKEVSEEFGEGLRDRLLKCFREDQDRFGYMKGNERWRQLLGEE